jgi:hypothetical protein
MREIYSALLALDYLYFTVPLHEYEEARHVVEMQVQRLLPGFTIAYVVEMGTVGAGDTAYQHGGVAHVLLPVREQTNK